MNGNFLFAAGTLLTWVGYFYAFRAVLGGARLATNTHITNGEEALKQFGISSIIAAITLIIGSAITHKAGSDLTVPLVWFMMPLPAWIGVVCFGMLIARVVQWRTAINEAEGTSKFMSAIYFGVAVVICFFWFKLDPKNVVEPLKGSIPLSWQNLIIFILLAVGAVVAMVLASRHAASRGLAKTIVSHIVLVTGSIVFGIPFAFLVITSFKEDRDMSSKNGIVWVPQVQDVVMYKNPKNRWYEATFNGATVQGTIIESKGDQVRVDIQKPLAIRGTTFETTKSKLKEIPQEALIWSGKKDGKAFKGFVVENLDDGRKTLEILEPQEWKGKQETFLPDNLEPVRHVGLRWQNYTEAFDYLPVETNRGLVYLKNTLILVVLGVLGTLISSSIVAYGFSRLKFPGKKTLFNILLATMMLPGAVTLLPQFLIFRSLGWIDTLYPLWVPAFFGSAFNIFLLRQFFQQIPMELEDAAKIDGCGYLRTFWDIMMPQIKPALAVIAIWTFMAAWNNFMGPLIYINSPENMPLSYALQLFQGDRSGEPGLLMAFATITILPVLGLFFFTQRYFIEGVTLSGLGGR